MVCFDERPCVLHGEVVEPLEMRPGKPKRQDYEYERKGRCCLLIAFEPLSGFRMVEVSERRTAGDYTRFMQTVAEHYSKAEQIRLVQDNLKARIRRLLSTSTCRLVRHLHWLSVSSFTVAPKKASWLNRAEIELSVLVRQCLGRRIESQEKMASEIGQLVKERNEEGASVNGQFTPALAREKRQRHYRTVCPTN